MRWELLFADLEGQLSAADRAESDAEVAERSRAEWSRVVLLDRLRAVEGGPLRLLLAGGHRLSGVCVDAGPDWVVLRDGCSTQTRAQVLVPLHAVAAVDGVTPMVAPPPGPVQRRLGLRHALRALARERSPVRVLTTGGTLTGTIDRVGADHLDLAEHPVGEPRRRGAVTGVLAVPFPALLAVSAP